MPGRGSARSVGSMNRIGFMKALANRSAVLVATLAIGGGVLGFAGTAQGVDGTLELASQPSGIADPDSADAFFAARPPTAAGSSSRPRRS
jgi:hypothetical protein